MSEAVALLLSGSLFLAIGAVVLAFPGAMPDSGMVSPDAIESDPAAAAAEARRWNQLRGLAVAGLGGALFIAGFVALF